MHSTQRTDGLAPQGESAYPRTHTLTHTERNNTVETTTITLTALLGARPARTRGNRVDPIGLQLDALLQAANDLDGEEFITLDNGFYYQKGDNKDRAMSAEHIRSTFNRKRGDELKAAGLVVHVISWDENGVVLPEDQHYAILARSA